MKDTSKRIRKVNNLSAIEKITSRVERIDMSKKDREVVLDIIKALYEFREISINIVDTRNRYLVDTNVAIASCIRNNLSLPFQLIGKIFNKHHASIVHYCGNHDNLYTYDRNYKEMYDMAYGIVESHGIKDNIVDSILSTEGEEIKNRRTHRIKLLERENRALKHSLTVANSKIDKLNETIQRLSKISNW